LAEVEAKLGSDDPEVTRARIDDVSGIQGMRRILKGGEPTSLIEHRSSPGTDYDSYRDKDTLRTYFTAVRLEIE
jgi:hypothetical protein